MLGRRSRNQRPDGKDGCCVAEGASEHAESGGGFDLLDGVHQHGVGGVTKRYLRSKEARKRVGAVGSENVLGELRAVDDDDVRKVGKRELVVGSERVGKVGAQREVGGGAEGAGGEEDGVEGAVLARDVDGPPEEVVGDDAEGRRAASAGDEVVEGGAEGFGGLEEGDELADGDGGEGLGLRGEAVGGGGEGEGVEAERGVGGKGGAEGGNVARGGDEGDGECGPAAEEEVGEGDEGVQMTLGEEGEEHNMSHGEN